MLFQGFIHPLLVWGTLLAAVPLLIHLFNRQRHKPLQWAAMEFVLAAYKRTRRRAQLENLLLLLLRMAAVALLALAIARPFTGDDSPLSPLTESRRDLVLVVDASASTGYRESVESVFESILGRAREILEEFDGTRGDRVRLISAGARPRLVSARSPEDGLALLPALTRPTDEELDLAAVLNDITTFAEEEAAGTEESALEVRFLTDLQRATFAPQFRSLTGGARSVPAALTGAPADDAQADATPTSIEAIQRALDRLQELGVRIVVEDLGAGTRTPANLGIESVGPINAGNAGRGGNAWSGGSAGARGAASDGVVGPGVPTEIGVRVRNFGTKARTGIRVTLEVDGNAQPAQRIELEPRASTETVFSVVFTSPGAHTIVAALEGDRLSIDDTRATVVDVPEPIRVLLVNGDAHPEIDRDEVGVLQAILEPMVDDSLRLRGTIGEAFSPFSTTVVDANAFGADERLIKEADLVVLANVSSLSQRVFALLEQRVRAGMALFVTMGDRSSDRGAIDSFNARGWSADGSGLMPAKLFRAVQVPSRREAYYRCASFEEDHPALRFFADERWRPFLTEVPVYGFVQVEPIENARVLARLDDEAKSPLLVERPYDRGRVFLWTTSIDRAWSRVADSPSTLVPLVHELFRYATRGQRPSPNALVGDALTLETEVFPRSAYVVEPDGSRRPLDGEPDEIGEGIWSLPPIGPLERSGLWRVEWEAGQIPFSASIQPSEGDLDRLPHDELEAQHATWRLYDPESGGGGDDDDGPNRGEMWRWLAAFALAALVCETLWAAWIGRERRMA